MNNSFLLLIIVAATFVCSTYLFQIGNNSGASLTIGIGGLICLNILGGDDNDITPA